MEKLRKLNKKNFENGCWGRGGNAYPSLSYPPGSAPGQSYTNHQTTLAYFNHLQH